MNWKCFFGICHKWNLQDAQHDSVQTYFLYKCDNCEKIKIKEVWGKWKIDKPKKDDDEGKPPKGPSMTPDDFNASFGDDK